MNLNSGVAVNQTRADFPAFLASIATTSAAAVATTTAVATASAVASANIAG